MDLESRGIVLSMYKAKTNALISFAVTAKLICVLVFAYMQNFCFLMTLLNYIIP